MSLLIRLAGAEEFLFFQEDPAGIHKVAFQGFDPGLRTEFDYASVQVLKEMDLEESFFILPAGLQDLAFQPLTAQQYEQKVEAVRDRIRTSETLEKVVLSRPLDLPCTGIHLAETFYSLCKNYPQAYVYLWKTDRMLWLGASPELLGQYDATTQLFQTMSLAGTLPLSQRWSEKELLEQQKVTDYIREKLRPHASQIWVNDQYNYFSGSIKHLRNDIVAEVSPENLLPLIAHLHPTPAVCGFPKEQARQLIQETEGYNREYYAGYLQFKIEETSFFVVNLRCMQVFNNAVRLYVGGGLNALSDPEKEWRETELKSRTILENLVCSLG